MKIFDRYTNKNVSEKDMPNQIDFGRYCIVEDNDRVRDVTYSNLPTKKVIHQELLLDKNKSLQEILIDISIDIEKAGCDNFNVIPLIRRIRNKLGLNKFEKLLYEKVFHIEEIFRLPHYLLEREIEKVHVSRAKRIPSKSYQYLASHTEDWIHKSIVNFKPSRILNEELYLNFDVYENQLTIAFVERSLVYLNSRLKEIQDIKSFLSEYEKLLKNRNDQKGWHKKISRNLSLIGSVYEDDHFHGKNKDGSALSKTEDILNQINKRLLLLRKNELFELVNKRATQSILLRNTNVMVSHKHYRYIKTLWIELDKVKPEKSEIEKLKFEQDVIVGLRAYVKSLITHALLNNLGYNASGYYSYFIAKRLHLADISFKECNNGMFEIVIAERKFNIVVVGNLPGYDDNLNSLLKSNNMYLFYFHESKTIEDCRFVHVNPLDPDSVERVAILFRQFLLTDYLDRIKRQFKFKQSLKDFVHHLSSNCLLFSPEKYCYNFIAYPTLNFDRVAIKEAIESDKKFKILRSRIDRDNVINDIDSLINEISSNASNLVSKNLICFNCFSPLSKYSFQKFDFIKCDSCDMLIKDTENEISFSIEHEKYKDISNADWGMDKFTVVKADFDKFINL